jgi:hypothetical protein
MKVVSMKNTLFVILGFFICSLSGIAQKSDMYGYPYHSKIVNSFFNTYSIIKLKETEYINFYKKKEGWYAAVISKNGVNVMLKEDLLWSKKARDYKRLKYPKNSEDSVSHFRKKQILDVWANKYYSIYPYYGYVGWDMDVIEDYGSESTLKDSTLFALGKAYASHAANFLHNNYGYADESMSFKLPEEGRNSMSPEQLIEFRKYNNLSIKSFERLNSQCPEFQTIVGTINTKLSNEYVNAFLNLRIYQNEEEASKELKEGLYNPVILSNAKNYLTSCPKNAILFTNGDNDTYPLLYVQEMYGFRRDVLVVNISLLRTVRYINILKENNISGGTIPNTINTTLFKDGKGEYFVFYANDKYAELADCMDYFHKTKEEYHFDDNIFYYFLSKNLVLTIDDTSQIYFEIKKNYITRSEYNILNIIAANKNIRPICYAMTCSSSLYLGLNDYFQLNGLVYVLKARKGKKTDEQTGFIDTELLRDNLLNKFSWDMGDSLYSNEYLLVNNYKSVVSRLVNAFIDEENMGLANQVQTKFDKLFPNSLIEYGIGTCNTIRNYYKLGDFERGNEMAKQLSFNLKNNRTYSRKVRYVDYTDTDNSIQIKLLKELLEEYGQLKILEKED